MPATATRRRPAPPAIRDLRPVIESFTIGMDGPDFRVDREKGVIYGVKVYGLHSPNNHGRANVTEGTDYPLSLHRASLSIFEGMSVFADHPDRRNAHEVRESREATGVLRNLSVKNDGTYGELHVITSSELGPAILEDAEKRLGVYALSINAMPAKERVEGGKLIIEQFDYANSVDVVTRGGTNKSLWEHREQPTVKKTVKAILEAWVAKKSPAFKLVAKPLLEDDAPMAAEADENSGDPEAELWSGFMAAIMAIIQGEGDATEKAKKVGKYLKAHEKLTTEKEPTEEEDDSNPDMKKDEEKKKQDEKVATESLKLEVEKLLAKDACRTLCEASGFVPTPTQLKSLVLLESDTERQELIDGYKAVPANNRPTKSGAPVPRKDGKPVTESKAPADAAAMAKLIRD